MFRKIIRSSCILLLLFSICFGCISCQNSGIEASVPDDEMAIADYMELLKEPEKLTIDSLEKASYQNDIIFYNIHGTNEILGQSVEISIILGYHRYMKTIDLYFWNDMESGIHSEIKNLWNQKEDKMYDYYRFSSEEISKIQSNAIDIAKQLKAKKNAK